jgi:hypothetical protein
LSCISNISQNESSISHVGFQKHEFETFTGKFGVSIASIRVDNGDYVSAGFKMGCDSKQQQLTFCAMGGGIGKMV